MAWTPRLLNVAWTVSAFAWFGFWIVLLASSDRHDHKVLLVAFFVVGSPSQLAFIWQGLTSRRRRRTDVPPFLEPTDRPAERTHMDPPHRQVP